MNMYFPKAAVVTFMVVFMNQFAPPARAVEPVPLPEFPVLPAPGTEADSYARSGDMSIAVLRNVAYERCDWAEYRARRAMRALQGSEAFDFDGPGPEAAYRLAYEEYMSAKRECERLVAALNSRLAAEQKDGDSEELFDSTDPLTAQWAGTWSVRSKHDYGPAKGGSFPSQFTVKISWHGCEVTWNNTEQNDCKVNGRTLTFYGFHNNDMVNRIDYTFFHSGLTLEGEFSGTIHGKPAGGTYTGKKN